MVGNLVYLTLVLCMISGRTHGKPTNQKPSRNNNTLVTLVNQTGSADLNNNAKRWLESSYAQSYRLRSDDGGDMSSLESQSQSFYGDMKQDTKQNIAGALDEPYGSDMEAFLKPGKGYFFVHYVTI